MKKHEILSPQSRATLFDPPLDVASIVRHYTFSMEDLALIRQRRRDANRLGFAAHLAYLRYPGRCYSALNLDPITSRVTRKPLGGLRSFSEREGHERRRL